MRFITRSLAAILWCVSAAAPAQPAAGNLVVYSSTDVAAVEPLLKEFQSRYPGIHVQYHDMNTNELYNRALSERAAKTPSADVLWSSAMDLQAKLAADGYALAYRSPEARHLPPWAVSRNELYGTTYEPVVIAYNKRLLAADEIPQSHADLVRLLTHKVEKFKGKIVSYDIEKSGIGYLLVAHDARYNPGFWELARALGTNEARFRTSTATMLERISSGEHLLGYNILGSYAAQRAKKDRNIGLVYPSDYTLVVSRIMLINKAAANPEAAKLWLDYVLSGRGQTLLAREAGLGSIRTDLDADPSAALLVGGLGTAPKPIALGPELLASLEPGKRRAFLKQWEAALSQR